VPLAARLSSIWEAVRRDREAFEAAPDVGLVPKAAVRWLHVATNYGIRGGLSTVATVGGVLGATVVTLTLAAALAVAAPVVGVAAAVAEYAACAVLLDGHAPRTEGVRRVSRDSLAADARGADRVYVSGGSSGVVLLPLLSRAAQVVVAGAGQAALAAAAAGVAHPVAATAAAAAAVTAAAARSAVDAVAVAALGHAGRMPAADTWLAHRVGGPGVSASYYYRLDGAVVARSLQGRLEEWELSAAAAVLEAVMAAPSDAWAQFVAHTGAAAAGVDGDTGALAAAAADAPTGRRLAAAADGHRARLATQVRARRDALRRVTAPHPDAARLRPAAEAAAAAAAAEELVATFVAERLRPLGRVAAATVAAEAGGAGVEGAASALTGERAPSRGRVAASPGAADADGAALADVPALTRAAVRDVFGPDFFTPMAESDETLFIPVSFEPLLRVG